MSYSGWELKFFDASGNFRKYQFSLIKDFVGKKVLEVGPGTGEFAKKYLLKSQNYLISGVVVGLDVGTDDKIKKNTFSVYLIKW